MKVTDYLTEWLALQETSLQRSTYEALKVYFTRHLIPYFDTLGTELEELKPMQVQYYAKSKLNGGRLDGKAGGLSLVSVKKHISVLKQALNDAVLFGYIESNPADHVRLPRRKQTVSPRTVFLTAEEAQRLIEALRGSELLPIVLVTLLYGLRRSEVLGLRWEAIDFQRNTLTINHTVVKNLTIEAKDSTKTASSRRSFQLLPEVREVLWSMKQTRRKGSVYLFERADGSPMRPDCVTRSFQRALARAGLPKMRFHDLRHSTASILFDRGWELEDVKNWLGHTDIETTSNIYLHYGRERKVMLAKDLEGVFHL